MDSTARKSIFELMKGKYDLASEIIKIEDLLNEETIILYNKSSNSSDEYALEEFVDEYAIHNWKNCQSYIDCEEIRADLDISKFIFKCKSQYSINLIEILNYIEYILNIINMCNIADINDNEEIVFNKTYKILTRNINILLDHINYEMKTFEDEEKVLVVEKNSVATLVAELVDDELSFKIIEYNHHLLKENLNRKKEILKALADKVESLTDQLDKQLFSDFGFLVNNINIRHNNLEGKHKKEYIANMENKILEQWYDEAYQLMLLCIIQSKYNSETKSKIKQLKSDISN